MIDSLSPFDPSNQEEKTHPPHSLASRSGQIAASFFLLNGLALLGFSIKKKRRVCAISHSEQPIPLEVPEESPPPSPSYRSFWDFPDSREPQRPNGDLAYQNLRWKNEDKRQIAEIITTMGEKGKWGAVKSALTFRKYEAQMDAGVPLHPFKFLATIFTNPLLKNHMSRIFNDSWLKMGFMNGVNKGMNREMEELDRFIDPFCKEVGLEEKALRPLIRDRNWEGVVRLLLPNDTAHES